MKGKSLHWEKENAWRKVNPKGSNPAVAFNTVPQVKVGVRSAPIRRSDAELGIDVSESYRDLLEPETRAALAERGL